MDLNSVTWGEFKVEDVMSVEQTKSVIAKKDLVDGNIPYVTRTASNNGYMRYCGNIEKINKGNCITIGAETGVAFYQPNDFVAGNKVYRLSKEGLNKKQYQFLASVLNMQTKNYSYSNARIPEKICQETILLPITSGGTIDWHFMEDYITELEQERITELEQYLIATGLNDYELSEDDKRVIEHLDSVTWGEFKVEDLFASENGDFDIKKEHINGRGIDVVTAGETDNGILGKTDIPSKEFDGNSITVDMFGKCTYRLECYKMVTHARVFSLKCVFSEFNENSGLYMTTLLQRLMKGFNYSNMCSWNKVKDLSISLPITSDGTIDWQFMEDYIKAIEKLTIADVVKYKDEAIAKTVALVSAH